MLSYLGPFATDEDAAPLYVRYPQQFRAQDAFLELSEAGTCRFSFDPETNGVPFDVHHGRTQRWPVPATLTAQACEETFLRLTPLLQRVHDGLSVEWDGHNNRGRLDADAIEASAEIAQALLLLADEDSLNAMVIEPSDWVIGGMREEEAADNVGLTAETDDATIVSKAADLTAEAKADGYVLVGRRSMEEVLVSLRERLREKRAEEDMETE